MLREAARHGNVKVRAYLNFIMAKFGEQGVQQILTTGNTKPQGFDMGEELLGYK